MDNKMAGIVRTLSLVEEVLGNLEEERGLASDEWKAFRETQDLIQLLERGE